MNQTKFLVENLLIEVKNCLTQHLDQAKPSNVQRISSHEIHIWMKSPIMKISALALENLGFKIGVGNLLLIKKF